MVSLDIRVNEKRTSLEKFCIFIYETPTGYGMYSCTDKNKYKYYTGTMKWLLHFPSIEMFLLDRTSWK